MQANCDDEDWPCSYYVVPFIFMLNRPVDLAPVRRREKNCRKMREEQEESIHKLLSIKKLFKTFKQTIMILKFAQVKALKTNSITNKLSLDKTIRYDYL